MKVDDFCNMECEYLNTEAQKCDKYKQDLIFYDWFWRCDECLGTTNPNQNTLAGNGMERVEKAMNKYETIKQMDIITMASLLSELIHMNDYEPDDYDPAILKWLESDG